MTPQSFNRGTQFGAAGSSRSQYVTVEGGRDSSTNYAIDGVYVRSLRFNNLSLNPPLDAVQEVNVLRNSFTTEYGQGQAVVSIVTKSGSNRSAGSAYDYVRNESSEAANYFGQKPGDRTQAGFTAGGPVVKNRFFLFGGYEGLRATAGKTLFAAVPSPAQLAGNFSGLSTSIVDPLTGLPFPGNVIPASRFSNFAKTLAPTVPAPNNSGANNYRTVNNFSDDADTATVRGDQVLPGHNLFQRFMYYKGSQLNPSVFSYTNLPQTGRNFAAGDTWVVSPRLVNEIRFGYNYAYHLNSPISLDGRNWVGDIGLRNLAGGTDPIDYGRPGFTITGFTGNGEGGITQGATENIFSMSNATSWVKGRHNVRFGIQAQFRKYDQLTEVPPRGGFTFNGQFTGSPSPTSSWDTARPAPARSAAHARPTGRRPSRPFIDDNWQVSSALTLQMGLRWEYLGTVAREEQPGRLVRSGDRQDRVSRGAVQSAGEPGAADHQPGRLLSRGHSEEGSQQLRAASRPRLQRQRQDRASERLRRLLRQPQLERAAVLAARPPVLRTVLAAAHQDRISASTPTRCSRT